MQKIRYGDYTLVSPAEYEREHDMPKGTIRRDIHRKRIKRVIKFGSKWMADVKELDALFASRLQKMLKGTGVIL